MVRSATPRTLSIPTTVPPGPVHYALRMKEIVNELHLPLIQHFIEISTHQLLFNRQFIGAFDVCIHSALNLPRAARYAKHLCDGFAGAVSAGNPSRSHLPIPVQPRKCPLDVRWT